MESLDLQVGCALAGDRQERGSDATFHLQVLPGLLAVVTNSEVSHSPHPLPVTTARRKTVMCDLNDSMSYKTCRNIWLKSNMAVVEKRL